MVTVVYPSYIDFKGIVA